jgi:cytochrome c-type biogenesis protein CcsB
MNELFSGILQGLFSGTALGMSQGFFNLTAVLFFFSTLAYIVLLVARKQWVWRFGFSTAVAGCVAETFALGLRWYAAGWDHPPFTNMYESLVFFAWGIVVTYLVFEVIYKIRIAGAFVVPFGFAAMGLASLNSDQGISPLVPALQSIWLHLHVVTASVGYAAFLVAFGFSILFLIVDRYPMSRIFGTLSILNVIGLLAVTKGRILFLDFPVSAVKFFDGVMRKIPIQGTDPVAFVQIQPAGQGVLGFLCLALFTASAFVARLDKEQDSGQAEKRATLAFNVATGALTLMIAVYVWNAIYDPAVSIQANAYSFAMLACLWVFSLMLAIVNKSHQSFLGRLPKAKVLDQMAYRATMVAFPIMTLIIVTGAVWANSAWGRYWGWDPKETASLITWIIYLLYLHTRFTKGWAGRRSAAISIIGFISVVFTYLGVNLLLSGLHAYASQ